MVVAQIAVNKTELLVASGVEEGLALELVLAAPVLRDERLVGV